MKTKTSKTYKTSPAFLALSSDEQFDLVMASAGNGSELANIDGVIEILPVELESGRVLYAIVAWTPDASAYEIYPTFTPKA